MNRNELNNLFSIFKGRLDEILCLSDDELRKLIKSDDKEKALEEIKKERERQEKNAKLFTLR